VVIFEDVFDPCDGCDTNEAAGVLFLHSGREKKCVVVWVVVVTTSVVVTVVSEKITGDWSLSWYDGGERAG
jgi:hypothetical protein